MNEQKPNLHFFDITRQYQQLKPEVMSAFEKILDSQSCIGGVAVAEFEKNIAQWIGSKHAVTVASGMDALILGLKALGVKAGDEVITPAFSFFGSTGAITWLQATPVWVDIKSDTYCIDEKEIEKKITSKTKAIMPVHLYGQCADMDPILEISRKKGIPVIEDTAQSIGASYKGRAAGTMGDIGAISFYPTKNLGGAGDGGLIVTNNDDLAQKAALLKNHGMPKRYTYALLGSNSRLDALQCAYLNIKLKHLQKWNNRRAEIASYYIQKLSDLESKGLVLPKTDSANKHVYHQFVIRLPNREIVRNKLVELGVPTDIYYPKAIPDEPVVKEFRNSSERFPVAEKCANEVLALPIFPELTQNEVDFVVEGIRKALN